MKLLSLANVVLSVVILGSILACATTPPTVNYYQQYKSAMESAKTANDYETAKTALIKLIHAPSSSDKLRKSATEMLAYHLIKGDFGYFDEAGFIHWAKTLGSRKSINLKNKLAQIEKVQQAFVTNRSDLQSIFNIAQPYCEKPAQKDLKLDQDTNNRAAIYLHVIDCFTPELINDRALSDAFAKHLTLTGTRDNNALMSKGFELYAKNVSLENLNQDEAHALLWAKLQIFTFSNSAQAPLFKTDSAYRREDIAKLFRLFESDNDIDWVEGESIVLSIANDPKAESRTKARAFYIATFAASVKKREEPFFKYRKALIDLSIMNEKQTAHMHVMTGMFYIDVKQYYEGNRYFDSLLPS